MGKLKKLLTLQGLFGIATLSVGFYCGYTCFPFNLPAAWYGGTLIRMALEEKPTMKKELLSILRWNGSVKYRLKHSDGCWGATMPLTKSSIEGLMAVSVRQVAVFFKDGTSLVLSV